MSPATTQAGAIPALALVSRRVRAFFAPVNRSAGIFTVFDPAQLGRFSIEQPPAPWIDLGWVSKFSRSGSTKTEPVRAGAPAIVTNQARSEIDATVSLVFETWGKLQAALASGSQQTNLLATASGAAPNGSGGVASAAVPLLFPAGAASSAVSLNVGAAAAGAFAVGAMVAVDVDYAGQLGYVGTGVSGAYVQSSVAVAGDVNYVRRVSLNVAVVVATSGGVLTLAAPLPAGNPTPGMQVSQLVGFCDREGGSFFQEWSALFALDGEQGDRVLYHYPRLQAMQSSAEREDLLGASLERTRLAAAFRAMPVKDTNDGETVVCFRSYLPAPLREI